MVKRLWLLIMALTLSVQACTQGISFAHDSTLAALKARARTANKPIFIDCYTTWCGPCKWMAKNVFPNDTVGRFFNEHFICAKIDMEKGDGKKIASAYKVSFYPTFLFLDTAGRELHRSIGAQSSKEFIETAEKSLQNESRFGTLKERYKKGERDPAFIRQYIKAAQKAGEPNAQEAADWYFAVLPPTELVTKENFELIELSLFFIHQPAFKKLFDHRHQFANVVGSEKVNAKITQVYEILFREAFIWNGKTFTETPDEKKYAEVVELINHSGFEKKEPLLAAQHIRYLKAKNDYNAYLAALKQYVPVYLWNNADELNSIAWDVYETATGKEDLQQALAWSKRSLELADNHYNNDTYAALCYKLKRKKEALKHAEKAVAQAEAAGEKDILEYRERLEMIRKM